MLSALALVNLGAACLETQPIDPGDALATETTQDTHRRHPCAAFESAAHRRR